MSKEKNISVSIIVPVYNVEQYLRQCLDSVVGQTLRDVEIILVNDGSTDHSEEICQEYVSGDSRVLLLNQKNAGLAAARQAGMEVARGEYIGFVDSDDWLEPSMYEEMYSKAKDTNSDIVFCNVYRNENKKEQIYFAPGYYDRPGMEKVIFPRSLAAFDENKQECSIRWCNWLRLYRKALIDQYHITFDSRFRRCQDLPFTFECTIHANSYCYMGDRYLYHNRMNFESLSKGYTQNMWGLLKPLVEYLRNIVSQYKEYDFTAQMQLRYVLTAFECADNETKPNNKRPMKERIATIRSLMCDKEIQEAIRQVDKSRMGRIYCLYVLCFRMKAPRLFYRLSAKRYATRTAEYKKLTKNAAN